MAAHWDNFNTINLLFTLNLSSVRTKINALNLTHQQMAAHKDNFSAITYYLTASLV